MTLVRAHDCCVTEHFIGGILESENFLALRGYRLKVHIAIRAVEGVGLHLRTGMNRWANRRREVLLWRKEKPCLLCRLKRRLLCSLKLIKLLEPRARGLATSNCSRHDRGLSKARRLDVTGVWNRSNTVRHSAAVTRGWTRWKHPLVVLCPSVSPISFLYLNCAGCFG